MADYAYPETLVSTDWVAQHSHDANVRVVEVDVDTKAYKEGHVPGAIGWDWNTQLCDVVRRDILSKEHFEKLMAGAGITNSTTVVLYGDNNNWFAAWALWQMKMYGHKDVRIMNGGRKKWLAEGREVSTDVPTPTPATYEASGPDNSLRAYFDQVRAAMDAGSHGMVDVRSPQEFSGEILAPPVCRRPASAAATSPARVTFPGGRPATMTAPSNRPTN